MAKRRTGSNDPLARLRAVEDARFSQHICARAGYNDALAGRGYPYDYDDWDQNRQLAYESGRLWLANLLGAHVRRPAWKTLAPPALLLAANETAHARVDGSLPGAPLPPTEDPVLLEPEPRLRRRAANLRRRRRHA